MGHHGGTPGFAIHRQVKTPVLASSDAAATMLDPPAADLQRSQNC